MAMSVILGIGNPKGSTARAEDPRRAQSTVQVGDFRELEDHR